jgi:hypothetical protein
MVLNKGEAMIGDKRFRCIALMVIIILLGSFVFCPARALAEYKKRSFPLPGISTESLVIGALVSIAVIAVIYFVTKEISDIEEEEPVPADSTDFSLLYLKNDCDALSHRTFRFETATKDLFEENQSYGESIFERIEPVCIIQREELLLGIQIRM